MFRKLHKVIGIAIIIALTPVMLAATPDAAQAQTRTEAQPVAGFAGARAEPTYSFGTAAGPVAGWIQLESKSSNWFKFKYDYDNSDSDNEPTQALVGLKMETPGCVTFDVWTPARLLEPQHNSRDDDTQNDRVTSVGSGTPQSLGSVQGDRERRNVSDPLHLTWAGSARASDTYYIVIKNNTTAACNYSLSISGPDVSF